MTGLIDQLKALDWRVEFDGKMFNFRSLKPESDPDIGRLKKPRYVSRGKPH
jgi:arginase